MRSELSYNIGNLILFKLVLHSLDRGGGCLNINDISRNFATNIELVRQRSGLSQVNFAKSIHMSVDMYKRVQNESRQASAADIFIQIFRLYHITLYELCGYTDKYIRLFQKLKQLDDEQFQHIEHAIDYEIRRNKKYSGD